MEMTFYFNDSISEFLFRGVDISSWPDLIAAMFAVFLVAVALELMKLVSVKLVERRRRNPLHSAAAHAPSHHRTSEINGSTHSSPLLSSLRIPSSVSKIRIRRLKIYAVEAILHLFKVTLGYILMLVVMTYNAYIFITVILALSFGYYFLAPLRTMRAPHKARVPHESLTSSERHSLGGSIGASIIESADHTENPYYGSIYQ